MSNKLSFLLTLFFLISVHAFSQNWSPINSAYKYNYFPDSLGYPNTVTIRVDSSELSGSDSVFYLNRVVIPIAMYTLLKNRPQFLQRKMVKKSNGDILFQDTASYLLKPQGTVGDTWTFDSVNNITAQLIDSGYLSILGNPDSVKYILLSSSDTLVISKNYGLIRFSVSYQDSTKYVLAGIEGLNAGLQAPGFWDFFNFNVGDVFEYHCSLDHQAPSSFSRYTYYSDEKYTILSKQVYSDRVNYTTQVIRRYAQSGFQNYYSIYSNYLSSISFSEENYSFLALENNAPTISGNYYEYLSFFTDTTFGVNGKECKGEYSQFLGTDTLKRHLSPYREYNRKFASGRGLVSSHKVESFWPTGDTWDTTLTGCILNGITYGTIHPDSFFVLGINPLPDPEISVNVYPNPFRDQIDISTNSHEQLEIIFYDIASRKLLQEEFTNFISLRTDRLSNGIYIYEIRTGNNIAKRGKLLKQ